MITQATGDSGDFRLTPKRHNIIGIQVLMQGTDKILRDKGTMKGIIDPDFKFEDRVDEIKAYVIKDPVMHTTKETVHYKGDGL